MSHTIPSYYRYVSSLTVVNVGAGYDSLNPPTITITGGGGEGATAECTVVNSVIDTVTVTNIGTGYTSSPTVTLSGSGGGELTANLSFAAGPTTEYDSTLKDTVKYSVPEFVREEYSSFILFLEKYYEWMEEEDNPIHILLNANYNDIDSATSATLDKWALQLAPKWPQSVQVDRTFLYKNIKDIYEAKGSRNSIETFFRVFYGEEVEVSYPSEFILRASDGRWQQTSSVKATAATNILDGDGNIDIAANQAAVLALAGKLIDISYYYTVGSVTVAKIIPATVSDVLSLAYTSPQQYEIFIDIEDDSTVIPGTGTTAGGEIIFEGPIATVDNYTDAVEVVTGPFLTGELVITGTDTITRSDAGGSFVTDGYIVGGKITILSSGEAANLTDHFIATVSATEITITASTALTNVADDTTFTAGVNDVRPDGTYTITTGSQYENNTVYVLNDQIQADGNLYICVTAGTSALSGAGPTGSGAGITDGTAEFDYVSAVNYTTTGSGISATFEITVAGGAGSTSVTSITDDGVGFVVNETIRIPDSFLGSSGAADLTFDVATLLDGELSVNAITLLSTGASYTAAPVIRLIGTNTVPAVTYATVLDTGALDEVKVVEKGFGYTASGTELIFDTDPVRTFITLRTEQNVAMNAKAYLDRCLVSAGPGVYSGSEPNAGFTVGQFFIINEAGDITTGYAGTVAAPYFAGDYVAIGGVNKAYMRVSSISENGVPLTWEIVESGYQFTLATTNITLISETGESIIVPIYTEHLFNYAGKYADDRGKISDVNVLQDNEKYQNYSYIVKSSTPQVEWDKNIKDTIHPAGWNVFGELKIVNELDYSMDIEVPGYHIRYFPLDADSDGASISEVVAILTSLVPVDSVSGIVDTVSFLIEPEFVETPSAQDAAPFWTFYKNIEQSVSATESTSKSVSTLYSDTATSEDVLAVQFEFPVSDSTGSVLDVPVISFVTSFIDSITNVTESDIKLFGKVFADSSNASETINTIDMVLNKNDATSSDDVLTVQYEFPISDNSTVSEVIGISFVTSFVDSITNVTESDIKLFGKVFVDSSNASEAINTIDMGIGKTDTTTSADVLAVQFEFPLSDNSTVSEVIGISTDIPITDATSSSDDLLYQFEKSISDIASVTETVSITSGFTVGISDNAAAAGILSINTNTVRTDSTTVSESGLVVIQDYADPAYFLEDYVGASYII